jgi:hypothetical protein
MKAMFTNLHRCRDAAVIALCLGTSPLLAQPQSGAAFTLREGIVVDTARGVAYVMTPEGGVAAVDTTNGALRWRSMEAAKPLAIVGSALVAQVEPKTLAARGALELVVLNDDQRGALGQRSASKLPDGVRVSIGDTLEGTFRAVARASDGRAVVSWSFVPQTLGGMAPDVRDEGRGIVESRAPPKRLAGVVSVDVSNGSARTLDAAPEKLPIWIVSRREIDAKAGTQYESADGKHILLSERIGDDRTFEKYRWTAFDRATKRKLGELRMHLSFSPFVIRDSILVYWTTPYATSAGKDEPAKLRGVHLASGREAWSVPVREVVWRDSLPP